MSDKAVGLVADSPSIEAHKRPHRSRVTNGTTLIKDKAVARLTKGAKAAFLGDLSAPEKALVAIGVEGVASVQNKIVDGPFGPLSERTLAARKARGVTRESPLVDTEQLRNSVKAVVVMGNSSY